MPNKISQFWQELKHRNVIRVMTVYIAVSFGLIELIDIVSGSLNLPGWTIIVVMVIAAIGLPIAFLLSWIFPKSSDSLLHQDSLYPEAKTELNIQDIEIQPDEMLPHQFSTLATYRNKSHRRLQDLMTYYFD
jgi:hypothetical protein